MKASCEFKGKDLTTLYTDNQRCECCFDKLATHTFWVKIDLEEVIVSKQATIKLHLCDDCVVVLKEMWGVHDPHATTIPVFGRIGACGGG